MKKQQSTQQPSRKPGKKNERLWDTPARPITPTGDVSEQQPEPNQKEPTKHGKKVDLIKR